MYHSFPTSRHDSWEKSSSVSASSSGGGHRIIIALLMTIAVLQVASFAHQTMVQSNPNDASSAARSWDTTKRTVKISFEKDCHDDINEDENKVERLTSESSSTNNSTAPSTPASTKEVTEDASLSDLPQFLKDMPSEPQTHNIKVGICSIMKGSERYLDEWVDYHLYGLGFDSIFIFDNSDNFTLAEYAKRRAPRVQTVSFTKKSPSDKVNPGWVQLTALNECTATFGPQVDVMAYFDDDEFLVLKKHRTVGDYVNEYLAPNTSVSFNWQIFGTANHTQYSPIPVTKRFQYREQQTDVRVKPMVHVADFGHMANPHAIFLKEAGRDGWRDSDGQAGFFSPNGAGTTSRPSDVAVLHHYKYKSEGEFRDKSCNRKDVLDRDRNKNCGAKTTVGVVKDDTAWQILKARLPQKYGHFDDWTDYF